MLNKRIFIPIILLLCVSVATSGCKWLKNNKYKGPGFTLTIPKGWTEGEPVEKEFMRVSNEKPQLVTFTSPEKRAKYEDPTATISVYTQRFDAPLWVEDITGEISQWIAQSGYTILGEGKINYQGSVGFSINYHDERTSMVYLDFFFASDAKIFLIIEYAVPESKFTDYIEDFEAFRNSLEFGFSIF